MKWRAAFYTVNVVVGLVTTAHASRLSTTFASVLVNNVKLGQPRIIEGPEGRGLVLKNGGDEPIVIHFQALAPTSLKAGASPLPDLSWLSISPSMITVPPHSEKAVRLMVRIPAKDEHRDRLYQVTIWSRAQAQQQKGMSYNAALLSTLRIKTLP